MHATRYPRVVVLDADSKNAHEDGTEYRHSGAKRASCSNVSARVVDDVVA